MTKDSNKITTQQIYDLVDRKTGELRKDIQSLEMRVDGHFITREEFEPIKRLVYGMVAVVLTGVFGALLALVLRQ